LAIAEALPGSYTIHVVWTPRMDNAADAPDYFGIMNVFHELMYLRGLMFGRNSMSPITFSFTTERIARELGQSLAE
jgi:hypothetical protein